MLGKETGYGISTCQMLYDANNKDTHQKNSMFRILWGNGPLKCRKHQVSQLSQMICDGIHVSNICTKANGTLGFLNRNLYTCPQEDQEVSSKKIIVEANAVLLSLKKDSGIVKRST